MNILHTDAGPFLADAGQLVVAGDEAEVPAGPFAFQMANRVIIGVEYVERAANGKQLLFEAADPRAVLVTIMDVDLREKNGDAAADVQNGLTAGGVDLDIKGRESFVVGEPQQSW